MSDYIAPKDRISPSCCEQAKSGAIILEFRSEDIYEAGLEGQEGKRPRWVVRCWNDEYHCRDVKDAQFCPFCGKKLPEIELSPNPPAPICKVTDGGYYCDTCHERLNCCQCLPPQFAWTPVEMEA